MSWWNSKPKEKIEIPPKPDPEVFYCGGRSCARHHVSTQDTKICRTCGDETRPAVLRELHGYLLDGDRWTTIIIPPYPFSRCLTEVSYEFVRYLDKPEKKVPKSSAKYEAWLSEVEASLRRPLYRTEIELAAGLYTQPATPKEAAKTIRGRTKK